MDLPRITFAGQFRADTSTVNNAFANYNDLFLPNVTINPGWNKNGTGEFSFFDCTITSVTYKNGTVSYTDPLVNQSIIVNPYGPQPKLVDLDPECQNKSTIFGMQFGLSLDNDEIGFLGNWQPSVIAQDMWSRSSCLSRLNQILFEISHWLGSKGTTKVKNITWGNINFSEALYQLHEASKGKELSVGQSYFFYTRSYPEYFYRNFTLGYVVGAIGVAEENEPLNFAGERLISFEKVNQTDISFSEGITCHNPKAFKMYKAPFEVYENEQRVTVDFGNSLSMNEYATFHKLSRLYLGFVASSGCIKVIAKVPYLERGWLWKTAGIVDVTVTTDDLSKLISAELVVVRKAANSTYTTCPGSLDLSESRFVEILLKESAYYIRPWEDYVYRLSNNQSQSVKLYVTHFGKPSPNTQVTLRSANPWAVPESGIRVDSMSTTTDSNGLAEFTFTGGYVPYPRNSSDHDQPLYVDGQVYRFLYYVAPVGELCPNEAYSEFVDFEYTFATCVNEISFHLWSDLNYEPPFTWVDHVAPIFQKYYVLFPIMSNILNLSLYSDVIKAQNIQLLNFSMRLDFTHPSYMPVTRDLSPITVEMILDWLQGNPPLFSSDPTKNDTTVDDFVCNNTVSSTLDLPESCLWNNDVTKPPLFALRSGETVPNALEPFKANETEEETKDICSLSEYYSCIAQMPPNALLSQWQLDVMHNNCSLESLRLQLQQALQLEFYTIPLYLTSLYSIKDGHNREAYTLIRSVLMQEMLHMTQAANLLIAVGGTPIIDSSEWAPKYPAVGLPGNVLPQLHVTLERASLSHIQRVFMGVEFPHNTSVTSDEPVITNSTIGQFYSQIINCMQELTKRGIDVFNESRTHLQVKWPWDNQYGQVYTVHNLSVAEKAIMDIVEQGEGASPIDPNSKLTGVHSLAHFYRFEEIVCGKHLVMNNDTYSYSGDNIAFDDCGVWPMRSNPSSHGLKKSTNAYTEARVFHEIYRSLLRKLQRVFSGSPDEVKDAIAIMESLQVHGKKLMNISLDPTDLNSPTVGPVWDYEWIGEGNNTEPMDPDSIPSIPLYSGVVYSIFLGMWLFIHHVVF